MKLSFTNPISLRLLVALFVTGLLLVTAVGCGDDDDDDNDTSDASVKGGSGGGSGTTGKGGSGGKGGGTAGKGGGGGTGGTATAPKDAAECVQLIKENSPADYDARTQCLCDKCLDSWGPCMIDEGCQAIIKCSAENNCLDTACAMNKCSDVMGKYGSSILIASPVGTCNQTAKCNEAGATDSGI
jgi:hypothetical protein